MEGLKQKIEGEIIYGHWLPIFLRGLSAFGLGVIVLIWTELSLELLLIYFGIYAFLDAIFSIGGAVMSRRNKNWWLSLIRGLIGFGLFVMIFTMPVLTEVILVYLIAAWALVIGIFEALIAFSFSWKGSSKAILLIVGIISVIFGGVLFFYPFTGVIVLLWIIGSYGILFGIMQIIFSLKVKNNF